MIRRPVAAPQIDLSFARYVAARKGEASARAREGAGYAYAGDLAVRSRLEKLRPVTLAMEAAVRFWQTVEKGRMLGTAVKVNDKQFPAIHRLAVRAAGTLRIPLPTIYVSPEATLGARTFGTTDEAFIVLCAPLVDHLGEIQLLDAIGHECGHIHNQHAIYLTTLHFLGKAGSALLRWAAKPATLALNAWARAAEITCDRAGVLCTRDLDASVGTLVRLAVGSKKLSADINLEEYLRQMEEAGAGPGRFGELLEAHPYLPKRVQALRVFADTAYYRGVLGRDDAASGLSKEECDARVSEILAVVRKS